MTDKIPGIKQPELNALPQIGDRMTFIYLEHCTINRKDGAITAANKDGLIYIPAASVSVLILGPGTDVSHRALELIGDAGVTVIWTGEHGVRYHASGHPLTHRQNVSASFSGGRCFQIDTAAASGQGRQQDPQCISAVFQKMEYPMERPRV